MRVKSQALLCAVVLLSLAAGAQAAASPGRDRLLDRYCVDCHNTTEWSGGLALDAEDSGHVGSNPSVWENVVRKVRAGMMPPAGHDRPSSSELARFARGLEADLDRAAVARPVIASAGVRRLNRAQYANAVRDLLGLDIDVAASLPADDVSHGFDNGEALGSSPALIEGYVGAALRVSRRAVGDVTTPSSQKEFRAPVGPSQRRHVDGLPLGTRGGLRVRHDFPLDAVYEIRVAGGRPGFGDSPQRDPTVQLLIDGKPQALKGGRIRVALTAGSHELAAAVIDDERSAGVDDLFIGWSPRGGVQGITVLGPYDATGVGDTPSRRAVFICRPESPQHEEPCARSIISRLSARAFRAPRVDDAAIERLMKFYRQGAAQGGFETGVQQALARILVDPRFLLRIEAPEASPRETQVALASRLSFLIWSSIPDEPLLQAADAGRLAEPRELELQVRRMLGDPRARALVDQFGEQWLQLRALGSVEPEVQAFDDGLRESLRKETDALLASVLLQDRSVLTLLDADYTFVDERLAEHYGIAGVRGSHLRKVTLGPGDPRRGLLGQGSILTLTSVANRTSPVSRGVWVLETLLGAVPPQPPANVNTNLDGDTFVTPDGPMPVRQRMELHRRNPACASCHQIMDPLGLALENFDLVGRWRTLDEGSPVDASGTLVDGTRIDGPATLRKALVADPEHFATAFTERLLSFALGRGLEAADMPAVREIVRQSRSQRYRFSALLLGVSQSPQFLQRNVAVPATEAPRTVAAADR